MSERYDAVVVGAGIVGVSTAIHLLMRGKKVLLIDRCGVGRETSYGNAGYIETSCVLPYSFPSLPEIPSILLNHSTVARIHYPTFWRFLPWIIELYFKSGDKRRRKNGGLLRPLVACALDEHRALMRGTDAEKYLLTTGRAALYRTEKSFAKSGFERQVAHAMGVPFEVMDAATFGTIEPSLRPTYHKAVVWTGSARVNNPGGVVETFATRFVSEGGAFLQAEAKDLIPSGGMWRIKIADAAIETQNVIVCTGPWANERLKPLGYRFPLGIKRGYHQHFAPLGTAKLSYAVVDTEYGYVLAPMEQGYRITTGAEFAAIDAPPNPAQIAGVLPKARELFPLGEPLEPKAWLGSRPCFADSLPVIGRAPQHPGLWFNFGHGHLGLTIGPSSGRLLAEMLCGIMPFCDPTPYRAERFS